jgi:RNA polymerase sigma factor (sigma-70 family)
MKEFNNDLTSSDDDEPPSIQPFVEYYATNRAYFANDLKNDNLGNALTPDDIVQEMAIVVIQSIKAGKVRNMDKIQYFAWSTLRNIKYSYIRKLNRGAKVENERDENGNIVITIKKGLFIKLTDEIMRETKLAVEEYQENAISPQKLRRIKLIKSVIEELKPNHQTIMKERMYKKTPFKNLADSLNMSLTNVKAIYSRTRKKIKERILKEEQKKEEENEQKRQR